MTACILLSATVVQAGSSNQTPGSNHLQMNEAAREAECGTRSDAINARNRGDNQTTVRILECLATRDDTDAQFLLGRFHFDVSQDLDEAEKWLRIAAEKGSLDAESYLSSIKHTRKEERERRQRYERDKKRILAKFKDVSGTFEDAVALFDSKTFEKGCLLAAKLANEGNAAATYLLGHDLITRSPRAHCASPLRFILLSPLDTPTIPDAEIRQSEKTSWGGWFPIGAQLVAHAAEGGFPAAQCLLGRLYAHDRVYPILKPNKVKARAFLLKAAKAENVECQFVYGSWLKNREDNLEGAVEWFLKAAEKGNHRAQFEMANYYLREGPNQDPDKAAVWLSELASQVIDVKMNMWARRMLRVL